MEAKIRHRYLQEQLNARYRLNGPTVMRISIGGIPMELMAEDSRLAYQLRGYFKSYEYHGNRPVRAKVMMTSLHEEVWEDPDPDFTGDDDSAIQRDFVGRRRSLSSELDFIFSLVAPDCMDSVHNLLRWAMPRWLLEDKSFLMHSAGVIKDGKGYLFFGQSGAGKSTCARLIQESDREAIVVGDDSAIIQLNDEAGVIYLSSAPLGCGYSLSAPPAQTAPLAGIFALQQALDNRIESVPVTQGVALLIGSAMHSPSHLQTGMDQYMDLAFQISVYQPGIKRLMFTQSPKFWEMIKEMDHEQEAKKEAL